MGKKKIALVDLSQSDTATLKATGVRSQKLTIKTKETPQEDMGKPISQTSAAEPTETENAAATEIKEKSTTKLRKRIRHGRSKRYTAAKSLIETCKAYPVSDAVKLLKEASTVKFDASVELHGNLSVEKVAGEMTLPHGTGKTLKVEIATDKTLTKLNTGTIDFDVLIAEPTMMPKLAKFAKLLGPKGLMPNPKTGTVTSDPQKKKTRLEAGQTLVKSEAKTPLMHTVLGKLSQPPIQLEANLNALIQAVGPKNITKLTLAPTMGPSVKIDLASFSQKE